MNPEQQDYEPIANSLQDQLKKFASSDTSVREKQLPGLMLFIKENLKHGEILNELFDINSEFNQKQNLATELTTQTAYLVEKQDVNPWTGEYTVVTIDGEGNIAGICCKPTKGLESYGDLHQYALAKSIFSLHLEKAGKEGGLGNEENFKYIKDLVGKDIYVFSGAPTESLVTKDGKQYYIGTSGCATKREYLEGLLAGATPAADTLAGYYDGIFSEKIKKYIANGSTVPDKPGPEPILTRMIRIGN